MIHAHRGASIVRIALPLWLGVAVVLGATGRIETLQPPAPQLVLVALTAGTLVALWLVHSLRAWVQIVDVRVARRIPSHSLCRCVLSATVSAGRASVRVCGSGRLGRHRYNPLSLGGFIY